MLDGVDLGLVQSKGVGEGRSLDESRPLMIWDCFTQRLKRS